MDLRLICYNDIEERGNTFVKNRIFTSKHIPYVFHYTSYYMSLSITKRTF